MMKHIIFTGTLLLASAVTGEAMAVCSGTQVTGPALTTLLQSTMVCKSNGVDWEWQEYHSGSSGQANNLIDYKKGADPIDPTAPVGKWTIDEGASTVTYDYGTGGSYVYTVHDNAGSYIFCTAGTPIVTGATISGVVGAATSCGTP